ncbi:hypothetical protein HAX54_011957, partial [Datura stramonium]|nr:hypothetical protein [Datura stramonium]
MCATSSLRRVILSPSFSDFFQGNRPIDMMEEDVISSLTILLKLSLTIWDFVLPATPFVPAVIGPLNIEQYNAIRSKASEIHAYAPDTRTLTSSYCDIVVLLKLQFGPSCISLDGP